MHSRSLRAILFLLVTALPAAASAQAAVSADQRAALQAQLDQLNQQITQNQSTLSEKQNERASLERDVSILDAKIKVAQLGIKARNLVIDQLKSDVSDKQSAIGELDGKVAAGQDSLAQILRQTREIDDTSLVETILNGNLSDLFGDIDNFHTVQQALGASFTQMANTRSDLSARKQALEEQQQEEEDLRQLQVLQQQDLQKNETDKQQLVAAARGQESLYQQLIATQKETAAQIRSALFNLRDTKAVSFGDMYTYAKEAGAKTSVDPAFILGILAEETDLGHNLGSGNWKVDMNPTRDQPVFQTICVQLGLNPDSMPVSKKPSYGWGGAMGPAQFIPSTWQLYEDRIAAATGNNPPNPWDPRTATFAAAILLMDNGADGGTAQAQRLAALRYLAGWKNATKSAYSFYGDDVMDLTAKFRQQIAVLGG